MGSIRMPSWLRMVFVAGAVVQVTGAGLFGYRWYSRSTTLTIAVGSLNGEATKLMSALASRLAAANAPVRLKRVETISAREAIDMFSWSKTDLAAVRDDVGDLSQAQYVWRSGQAGCCTRARSQSGVAVREYRGVDRRRGFGRSDDVRLSG